ncbi:MAG TPA: pilus assembly protein TadG-related protein [Candidatus Dormibacteraeota bacterium]|nr:pilus assembly protein TadG-related protein [Candidatus Dormibacteraeota bacterium]
MPPVHGKRKNFGARGERGVTLVLVALGLVVLLGFMTLAIDLGILYVARSEAQRTADAAALAGAQVFYTQGCVSAAGGCVAGGAQESAAASKAMSVASQNDIAGQPASVNCPEYSNPTSGTSCPDISFAYPSSEEPQITVTVERTGIPTIFARIFGVSSSTVSATAAAEAYSPEAGGAAGGGGASTTTACVAPFLVPNCDPFAPSSPENNVCPSEPTGYFANPNVSPVALDYSAIGQQWDLHFGTGPSDAAIPSEWYLVSIWPSGTPSKAEVRAAIQECVPVTCGQTLPAIPGKGVGPVDQGVEARINASGTSSGSNFSQGQDTIVSQPGQNPPYQIYAGANNPLVAAGDVAAGAPISPQQSPSVATVALYDGAICGVTEPDGTVETSSNSDCIGPGGGSVTVVGWMTLFLQGYVHGGTNDSVPSVVMSITPCSSGGAGGAGGGDGGAGGGTGGAGGGTTIVTPGVSPVPIRLIQHAD